MNQKSEKIKIYKNSNFRWDGVEETDYSEVDINKQSPIDIPLFWNITRFEITEHFHSTAFEVRYFEINQGGYSRLERHHHTHTIIVVRGNGVLKTEYDEFSLTYLDVVYIDSYTPHQLLNNDQEPFGFFCIVDRKRDKPIPLKKN